MIFNLSKTTVIFLKLKSIDALWSRGSYIVVCNKRIFHYALIIDDFCLAVFICHLVLRCVRDIFNCLHYGHLNFHPWSWWNFFRCSMWDSAGTWFTTSPSMAVTKASFKPKSCACTTYYVLTRSRDFYVCIEWYSKLQNKQKKNPYIWSVVVWILQKSNRIEWFRKLIIKHHEIIFYLHWVTPRFRRFKGWH